MTVYPKTALGMWLVLLSVCGWLLLRHTTVTTDLTALLPPSAGRVQRLLVEQLRDGVVSRLILIGLEGADPEALAETSRRLARRLQESGRFGYVNNGEDIYSAAERDMLMRYRYLLSPTVRDDRFTSTGLREALQNNVRLLGSPAGAMMKTTLPSDPTGELLRILSTLSPGGGPVTQHGVWFSSDGSRAQLIAETSAPGFDIDRQEQVVETIRGAFAEAASPASSRLLLSGPGVFAVESRAVIERDSWRLSAMAGGIVIVLLFALYRSIVTVILSMLPVLTGLLAGIVAVGLAFGSVHGITLGFGATLIGEAVDYPTYLFTHMAPREAVRETLARIWPTLQLAVLTTVFGGLTMLLSSFRGLSQLGLLSMTGVLVAGLVTRWVLPVLAPEGLGRTHLRALPVDWTRFVRSSRHGAWLIGGLSAAAVAVLAFQAERIWDDDLANLSPVSESAKALDAQMRAELGAPDVRHLLVIRAGGSEEALRRSEEAADVLRDLVASQAISGFDLASQYLPSRDTQLKRRAALPDRAELQQSLKDALRGLPFREGLFEPFLRDVEQTRRGELMKMDDLQRSALSLKLRSLLFQSGGEWIALAPLRGIADEATLAAHLGQGIDPHVFLLDLKAESNRLVSGYRRESLRLTMMGLLVIGIVLWWGLHDSVRLFRVLVPVLVAILFDVALLTMLGERLSLFHLVSLLLVVGIGLNYALFFNRDRFSDVEAQRTALSLTVCSLATLSAFGVLAFSRTPVLHAIGLTVSLGSVLALVVSAVLAKDHPLTPAPDDRTGAPSSC